MDFRQARSEYLRLRHAYRSGQIPPDQFEKQVNSMIVRSKGQIWMIGVKTGKWYRRDGKTWKEDLPEIDSADTTTVAQDDTSNKNKQNVKDKFKAVFARKPLETAQEKSFRQLTIGFSVAFIGLLLALFVVIGLMRKGVIETPSELSSIFPFFQASSEEDTGIGSSEALEENTTLSTNLVIPANGVISISGNISINGFLYTSAIRGTWLQRDSSNETLVIKKNGSIRIFSSSKGFEYTGNYSFIDDHNIRFQTDAGSVEAEIWIDADVLTLVINDLPLVYDRIE